MTTNLPAYLLDAPPENFAQRALANLGMGSPPYVSIMGNRFTLVDETGAEEGVATYDPKTGPYLDCVIADIGDHMSKIYYARPFDPSASTYLPPDCWSDNGVTPSRNASVPQSATCATCQWGMWGSKVSQVSGKGVKACSDFMKLALVIPGDDVTFLMRVPPNSLSNLRAYLAKFAAEISPSMVITRVSFEAGGIGTLVFSAVSYVDESTFKRVKQVRAAKATDNLVGRNDLPREALPAPAAQAALPAAAPAFGVTGNPPIEQQLVQQQAPLQTAQVQPAPFQPSPAPTAVAPVVQTALPPATMFTPGTATTPSTPAPEPQRRRRRTREQIDADNAAAARAAPAQQQAQPAATPPANGPAFGMAQGAPPPADLGPMLDSIFGPAKA